MSKWNGSRHSAGKQSPSVQPCSIENRCLGARISKVSGGSPAVMMSSLCKIQLLPEIPSGKRVDTKRPAQATITLFWNAAKQKKILVTVKAQPWDQRPAAMIFKFIYLYVFYIFLESSINKLYDDKTILQKKRKMYKEYVYTPFILSPRVSKYVNTIPPWDDVLIRTDNLQLTLHYVHCNKYTVVNRQTRL